jgi:hypothetical protein
MDLEGVDVIKLNKDVTDILSDFYNVAYYLNPDKTYRKCTTTEWSEQCQDMRASHTKHVGDDYIGEYRISTVWLGIDHQYGDGDPLLFETMVFDKKDEWNDCYTARYSTWDEAVKGHEHAKQLVLDGKI